MSVRIAKARDREVWDKFLADSPAGNFRQSFGWGKVKERSGWQALPIMVERDGQVRAVMMVLKKRIPLGFSLFYACRGPVLDWNDSETVHELAQGMKTIARNHRAILLRVDPEPAEGDIIHRQLQGAGFCIVDEPFTAWNRTRYEIRVPLYSDVSDDEFFMTFRKTHRQNIKTAYRKGVTVDVGYKPGDEDIFFGLMQQLEARRYAIPHDYDYYEQTIREIVENGDGDMVKAVYDGKVISAMVLAFVGDRCWGVFQANDYDYRKLMPNKLVVWECARLAKARGCRFLDLGATQGVTFDSRAALDSFKMGYRPDVIRFPEYFDLPFNPLLYRMFVLSEFKVIPMVYKLRHKGILGTGSNMAPAS